jgi:hypothetical protein
MHFFIGMYSQFDAVRQQTKHGVLPTIMLLMGMFKQEEGIQTSSLCPAKLVDLYTKALKHHLGKTMIRIHTVIYKCIVHLKISKLEQIIWKVNTLNSRCLDNAWITKKVMVTKLRNI